MFSDTGAIAGSTDMNITRSRFKGLALRKKQSLASMPGQLAIFSQGSQTNHGNISQVRC